MDEAPRENLDSGHGPREIRGDAATLTDIGDRDRNSL